MPKIEAYDEMNLQKKEDLIPDEIIEKLISPENFDLEATKEVLIGVLKLKMEQEKDWRKKAALAARIASINLST